MPEVAFHPCWQAGSHWGLWSLTGVILQLWWVASTTCWNENASQNNALPCHKGCTQGLNARHHTFFCIKRHCWLCCTDVLYLLHHLYADDPVLCGVGPSLDGLLAWLQDSFLRVQQAFSTLNLLFVKHKISLVLFSVSSLIVRNVGLLYLNSTTNKFCFTFYKRIPFCFSKPTYYTPMV